LHFAFAAITAGHSVCHVDRAARAQASIAVLADGNGVCCGMVEAAHDRPEVRGVWCGCLTNRA